MITIRQNTARNLRIARRISLLCAIHVLFGVTTEPRPAQAAIAEGKNIRPPHLTTNAGFRGNRGGRAHSPARRFQNTDAQGGHARARDLRDHGYL